MHCASLPRKPNFDNHTFLLIPRYAQIGLAVVKATSLDSSYICSPIPVAIAWSTLQIAIMSQKDCADSTSSLEMPPDDVVSEDPFVTSREPDDASNERYVYDLAGFICNMSNSARSERSRDMS
jgi:hypothetical protein